MQLRPRDGAGSPHARYAIVTEQEGEWAAEFRAVEYARDDAAAIAEQRGKPDWAVALRTGRMDPRGWPC